MNRFIFVVSGDNINGRPFMAEIEVCREISGTYYYEPSRLINNDKTNFKALVIEQS